MFRVVISAIVLAFACIAPALAAPNLSITSTPYSEGGFFANPVLPQEGQPVTFTVRAACPGYAGDAVPARLTLLDPRGGTAAEQRLDLARASDTAEAAWTWSSDRNGLYTARVVLDPDNAVAEDNENDNAAELVLPVIVKGKGRGLHFPWYRLNPAARWATCVTSAGRGPELYERLAERGIIPLNWAPGTTEYDREKAKTQPEAVLAEVEENLFHRYASESNVYGCGIDEVGGYPATFSLDVSVAAMKGLIRAREQRPDAFYAVWNSGGVRPELAAVCRQAADLYLLETYLWRALPEEIGAQDIYAYLVDRIDPFVRQTDMFQPAYGNHCYTLLALDTTERPDLTDFGELEQVVRFIRQRFPEMRGIGWYNGSTRMEQTEQNMRKLDAVQVRADELCFEYWVKPCLTFLQQDVWLTENEDGSRELVAALSNIGSVDSREVVVEFFVDGERVGSASAASVPAGASRYACMVQLRQAVSLEPGSHEFEARVASAPDATVLNGSIELARYVP